MTTPNPTPTAEQSTSERAIDKMHRETGIPMWALETAYELSTLGMLDEETMAGVRVIPDTARIIAARVHRDVAGGEALDDRSLQGSVEITVFRDGQILAVNSRNFDGFCGVGGKVERGESFEDAVRRELTEETGCEARTIQFVAGHTLDPVKGDDQSVRWYCAGFVVDIGDQQPRSNEEGTVPFWTTKENMIQNSLFPVWYSWWFGLLDELGIIPSVAEPTEGAKCVKCGHGKGDPRRRGSGEYSSFCIYGGCGCKCQFSLEDLITTTRNAEQRIFLNNIAAVLDASDVEVFTALVMKAKQSPDLGSATRSALRSETEICAAERARVWEKAIEIVTSKLWATANHDVGAHDTQDCSACAVGLQSNEIVRSLQAAANDEAKGE